jgi:hypothetical protein
VNSSNNADADQTPNMEFVHGQNAWSLDKLLFQLFHVHVAWRRLEKNESGFVN